MSTTADLTPTDRPAPAAPVLTVDDHVVGDGGVRVLTLNRPEKRNALNGTALEEIAALFTALQSDFETRENREETINHRTLGLVFE